MEAPNRDKNRNNNKVLIAFLNERMNLFRLDLFFTPRMNGFSQYDINKNQLAVSQRKMLKYRASTNNFYFILRESHGDVTIPFLVVAFLKTVNSRSIEIDAFNY